MKLSHLELPFLLLALLLLTGIPAWGGQAEDELSDLGFLTMGEAETPARSPRPASRIAENVTVITADQIEALNAHTLAEVLNTVPGIQFEQVRTPGSWSFFNIQGAVSRHIQVLIDGVPQNDLVENAPDLGLISVQHIERIEIIKGAASAAWGQALGGVVNIVTKSPEADKPFAGAVFSSYGEQATSDLRGELSGTVNRFGYYLSGGNLHSDGLLPDNSINRNNAYGKITYDLPSRGYIIAGFDYRGAARGIFSAPNSDDLPFGARETDSSNYGYSFLNFVYPFQNRLKLDLLIRESRKIHEYFDNYYDGEPKFSYTGRERTTGGSAKLIWGDTWRNVVVGADYEHANVSQAVSVLQSDLDERVIDRWGIYSNGAVTVGDLTILPGIRFDNTGIRSNLVSYTLGATYQLTDKTVLRCYGAKGYSLPSALRTKLPERVWTAQVGAESSEVPYLWLKGTFFYNRLWDIDDPSTGLKKAEKQGVEIEVRTVPVYDLSLIAGYTFTDARNTETDERINNVPAHSAKLALQYADDFIGLHGTLTGNYVRWNEPDRYKAKDGSFLWDLSLTKRIAMKEYAPEIFFTVHNVFNNAQYQLYLLRNTGRWLEGGVRFRF
ncbi:TonB-dependent receptor plug domain-containing protein [Geotalea sp. SG265]|uniref:TonB-dependent receptor plug domain-containing protein n=1 Tax=Geotalea sp. SG265 TaxID=2922867 RepID=UPI001FB00F7F|nr:TonB-dependent receptor plug domain-containing protein [Geotalea sp. SG265]